MRYSRLEHDIDEALEQSFPASDPPPWTLGERRTGLPLEAPGDDRRERFREALRSDRLYSERTAARSVLAIGDPWVHLRLCLTCGHVGCCDDSKNKHATRHYHKTQHPIIQSLEPGEDWWWCYPDNMLME